MSEQLNEVISRDSLLSELDKSLEDGSLVEISVGDSRKRFKPYERVEDEGTVNFYGRAYNYPAFEYNENGVLVVTSEGQEVTYEYHKLDE